MYYNKELIPEKWMRKHYWYRYAINQEYSKIVKTEINDAYEHSYMLDAYKKAVKWYNLSAIQNDACAQNNLGLCFFAGHGVKQNYRIALFWFNLAARQGNYTAEYNLGRMYYYGKGVRKNYKSAVYWFKFSANQGDSSAQAMLGYAYYKGNGVTKNYIKSLNGLLLHALTVLHSVKNTACLIEL